MTARKVTQRALWKCPKCRQTFVTRNMWHSCVRMTEADFFRDKPRQRRLYKAFLGVVRECGPVTINVNKSRISFQGRVRFAGVPRVTRYGILCGFWLKRRIESPRFSKVELFPPSDYVYQFKLTDEAQLDTEVRAWLVEAYRVGQQLK
jgi:hypothetical protein